MIAGRLSAGRGGALAALSAAGSLFAALFGGWDAALQVLIGFMAADYLTGLIVAGVFKRSAKSESGALESRAGFQGLMRKGSMLLLVYLAVLLDRAAQTGFIRDAVCLFFVANEGLSILENLGLMGVPYPAFFKNMLEALREQAGRGDGQGEA